MQPQATAPATRAGTSSRGHVELFFATAGGDTDYLAASLASCRRSSRADQGAATWLYGGGYLNPAGECRSSQMVRAARSARARLRARRMRADLVRPADRPRLGAGAQRRTARCSPAWMLGVRDELSARRRPPRWRAQRCPRCARATMRSGDRARSVPAGHASALDRRWRSTCTSAPVIGSPTTRTRRATSSPAGRRLARGSGSRMTPRGPAPGSATWWRRSRA